jgi:hypothetical protein
MASVIDDIDPDLNTVSVDFSCHYIDEDKINSFFHKIGMVREFTVLHVNCRSMPKNFDHLTTILAKAKIKPSVLAISETWLKKYNERSFILEGYSFYCNSRPKKREEGWRSMWTAIMIVVQE